MQSAVWVDDTIFVTKTLAHATCAGLVTFGGCPVCLHYRAMAACSRSYWLFLAGKLGLGLSDDKRQRASQRVTYTGLTQDTFLSTISIPSDKKRKLAHFLESFFGRRDAVLSRLTSLRDRIQHYSICLPFTLPFAAFISSIVGREDIPDYDLVVPIPPLLSDSHCMPHSSPARRLRRASP